MASTPQALSKPNWNHRIFLFLIWVAFYASFTLFSPPLLDDADSVHAEVAREMIVRHDWITLYANGIRYLEKAPLFYWSMAASFKAFGISAAASRLPLALSVLLLTLFLERFARTAFASQQAGLYAGLITLSSFGIFIFSRINIPDLLVCAWLALALLAICETEFSPESAARPARTPCLLFATACALNVLTKGLIGIVFPIGIVLAYLLLTRGWSGTAQRLKHLHLIPGIALFLLITTPWHILAALANPTQGHPGGLTYTGHFQVPLPTDGNVHGWAWFYFVNEQLLRYMNLRVPRDYDTVPLWLFLGLIFVWLMPWSAFLPRALADALPLRSAAFRQRLRTRALTQEENINLLLILWAALPLAFFSLSTRQEYYVLPSLPPMILLIARSLANPRTPTSNRIASTTLLAFGILSALACLIFLAHSAPPLPGTDLATLLQQNPGDYALSFGHFMDLNPRALGLFRIPLLIAALSLLAGTATHFLLHRRNRQQAATLALAAGSFGFLLAAWQGLRIFSPTLSSAALANVIAPQLHPEDLIVIHGEYEASSTLGFYLRRNDLHLVEGRSSNLWYGSFFPDAPKIFETPASLTARWPGPQRIFLWQDPTDPDRPPLTLPQPVFTLATAGGKQLLSNKPGAP